MPGIEATLTAQLQELGQRVGRLEQSVQGLLDDRSPGVDIAGETIPGDINAPAPDNPVPPLTILEARDLEPMIRALLSKLGYSGTHVDLKELKAQMVRDGLNPEERLAQRLLSEMRGYGPDWGE